MSQFMDGSTSRILYLMQTCTVVLNQWQSRPHVHLRNTRASAMFECFCVSTEYTCKMATTCINTVFVRALSIVSIGAYMY